MKQTTKTFWCFLAVFIMHHYDVLGPDECLGAVVPYDRLTAVQKNAFAERVQRVGLSVNQSLRLLDSNYLFKVELPAYRSCSYCRGSGCSRYKTSKVKQTVPCSFCNGSGRIQEKVDSSYSDENPDVRTYGSVQSTINYETRHCEKCDGTGRVNIYACEECGGSGYVAAGDGVYVVGKSPKSTTTQKAVIGKAFDSLRLINGKEIQKALVTKLTEEQVELRHSAGIGKYSRDEFVEEDALKLFGGSQTADDVPLPRGSLVDLTQTGSANDLAVNAVNQNDAQLLSLLMSMGVPLEYGDAPFLVLMTDKGDTNAITTLLSKGASVDAPDARGRSALRAAVERGDITLVSEFMARGADPNAKDRKSTTPLHVAAARGNVEMVDYLIDHGARVDSTDADGRTPYDYATASPSGKKVAEQMQIQHTDYAEAKALVAEDKYDEAIAIYRKYKDSGAAQYTLIMKGAYLEGRGRYQDALQIYRQANSPDEIQRVTRLLRNQQDMLTEAHNLEKAARYDDALAVYAQAGAVDEVTRLAVKVAKDMEAAKQYTKAAEYYETAGDWESAGKMRKLSGTAAQAPDQRMDAESVFKKCAPATVSILSGQEYGAGLGSGFIITRDGYLLTNYHVIEESSVLMVLTADKRRFEVKVVDTMPDYDLALLKIDGTGFSFIRLGHSDKIDVGAPVVAIGTPKDLTLAQSITQGIISGKRVYAGIPSFQTSVLINHGNSGGPLLDMTGKAIGITSAGLGTALVTRDGNIGSDIQGINFAIMIDEVRPLLQRNGLNL